MVNYCSVNMLPRIGKECYIENFGITGVKIVDLLWRN
jgi:hypothetical protein